MAMKVRCTGCRKKISIDEAFAGSVCRCPYCKTINMVAGKSSSGAAGRPDTPGFRPDAPMTTAQQEAARQSATREVAATISEEHIPTADPVKVQGIVSLILIGAIVLMIGVMIYMAILIAGSGERKISEGGGTSGSGYVNPLDEKPKTVAGMNISAPVIYILDGGSGMEETFDFARVMTISSVKSLGDDQKFAVLIAGVAQGDSWFPAGGLSDANESARASLKTFLDEYIPEGSAELPAGLEKALDRAEKLKNESAVKAIVMMVSRSFGDGTSGSAAKLVERAKKLGITITIVGMTEFGKAAEGLKKFAELTGGESVSYGLDALMDWDAQRRAMEEE